MVTENLLKSLQDLIHHCQTIRLSLADDKENFMKQDMTKLDVSNHEKKVVLNQLEKLIHDLSNKSRSEHKMSFMHRVQHARDQADPHLQQQYDQALSELKNEVALCYQSIAINSTIVLSNMNNLKRTWDSLLATKPKMDEVYDSKGKM